ncbi:MAG: UbiA-like polyprenyltransferase [Dehalococcoidia bacterium]|tara:strand:- start:428 stop:1318 length:891 start_codon:yes stop_codon:yes gene_type:complete
MSNQAKLDKPWSYMGKLGLLLDSIRFEHSIFALPFAYLGMMMAADGLPSLEKIFWITIAMVAARTLAMGANRYIDKDIDAKNPRTAVRALPAGRMKPSDMIIMCGVSLIIFMFSAFMLNSLAFALSPIAALVIVLYSYSKRFTWLSHFWLGLADGIAPVGGWIAVSNTITPESIILCIAVSSWIAGFDLIYQCMDREFDIKNDLKSIPARWGNSVSLALAKLMHIITIVSLITVGWTHELSLVYFIGVAIASLLLVYEHSLVKANDLTRVTIAFFNVNGYIALTIFAFTAAAILMN